MWPGVVLGEGQIVSQTFALERKFIVGKAAEQPRVITGSVELARFLLAEGLERGIEHEEAILRITEVSGLLVGAAVFLAVVPHEVEDDGIGRRMRCRTERGVVRPGTDAVEAEVVEHGHGLRGIKEAGRPGLAGSEAAILVEAGVGLGRDVWWKIVERDGRVVEVDAVAFDGNGGVTRE